MLPRRCCFGVADRAHREVGSPWGQPTEGHASPYDVYCTGGDGGNTTFVPGIPLDLIPIFGPSGKISFPWDARGLTLNLRTSLSAPRNQVVN